MSDAESVPVATGLKSIDGPLAMAGGQGQVRGAGFRAEDIKVCAAVPASNGDAEFVENFPPVSYDGGAGYGDWYWEVTGGGHRVDNVGAPAKGFALGHPNGSTFGLYVVRAHSGKATEIDYGSLGGGYVDAAETGMHATETVDYDVVISGKVDLHLPGGKVRTLTAGTLFVCGGVPHSWENPYDEDCLIAVAMIGYQKSAE